jgi:hypothetical protein
LIEPPAGEPDAVAVMGEQAVDASADHLRHSRSQSVAAVVAVIGA